MELAEKIGMLLPCLNEKQRRLYLASEALAAGRGGISAVSRASGVSRRAIADGVRELKGGDATSLRADAPVRRKGAGRKPVSESQPGIAAALEGLVSPETFGSPENPLRWTTKSLRRLAGELAGMGYRVGRQTVSSLLGAAGYSLRLNQKMMQVGRPHPDRDAQFRHINDAAARFLSAGAPVISVDCKKKELVGLFKNGGAEYAPPGCPRKVLDHDFPLPGKGKAAPYGVYDVGMNEGYVGVGTGSDTAAFAVATIRGWWDTMGRVRYGGSRELLITADGGGSNGARVRLWKTELQKFANESGLKVSVCHFPPGTSKWNKIEHRLFAQISKNWRGRPLETLEIIVSLIAATKTDTGLSVKCRLDPNPYSPGVKVSREELASVNLSRDDFHPEWNYTISPQMSI